MCENTRLNVMAVMAVSHGPVDLTSDAEIPQGSRRPVSHENGGVAMGTVHTGMCASPIGVDRPLEGHPLDPVQDGLDLDLDPLDLRSDPPAGGAEQPDGIGARALLRSCSRGGSDCHRHRKVILVRTYVRVKSAAIVA